MVFQCRLIKDDLSLLHGSLKFLVNLSAKQILSKVRYINFVKTIILSKNVYLHILQSGNVNNLVNDSWKHRNKCYRDPAII